MPTPLEDAQLMVTLHTEAIKQLLLGKEVRMGGPGLDRWHRMEDLPALKASLKDYEARAKSLSQAASGAPTFGGLSYSLADFSNPR